MPRLYANFLCTYYYTKNGVLEDGCMSLKNIQSAKCDKVLGRPMELMPNYHFSTLRIQKKL